MGIKKLGKENNRKNERKIIKKIVENGTEIKNGKK